METSPILSSTIYFYHLVNILLACSIFILLFLFSFCYPSFCHVFSLAEWGSNHCCSSHFLTHFKRFPWESALTFLPLPHTLLIPLSSSRTEDQAKAKFCNTQFFKIKFHLIIFLGHYIDIQSPKVSWELATLLLQN